MTCLARTPSCPPLATGADEPVRAEIEALVGDRSRGENAQKLRIELAAQMMELVACTDAEDARADDHIPGAACATALPPT